jgi:hypothetical protein
VDSKHFDETSPGAGPDARDSEPAMSKGGNDR